MHGKPAITCFKYQVPLYGEITMTYLKPILYTVTEPELCEMLCHPNCPAISLQAALPHFVSHHYLHHLEENSNLVTFFTYLKKRKKTF